MEVSFAVFSRLLLYHVLPAQESNSCMLCGPARALSFGTRRFYLYINTYICIHICMHGGLGFFHLFLMESYVLNVQNPVHSRWLNFFTLKNFTCQHHMTRYLRTDLGNSNCPGHRSCSEWMPCEGVNSTPVSRVVEGVWILIKKNVDMLVQ